MKKKPFTFTVGLLNGIIRIRKLQSFNSEWRNLNLDYLNKCRLKMLIGLVRIDFFKSSILNRIK